MTSGVRRTQYVELGGLAIPRETADILSYTAELTGKGFEFYPDQALHMWATVKPARKGMASHVVLYHPQHTDKLSYLLAHEAGHLVRMWSVPTDQRKVLSASGAALKEWATELYAELPTMAKRQLPANALGELIRMWQNGLLLQLANTAPDMRIERWLHESYPGLGDRQRAALMNQVKENYKAMGRGVREMTPQLVFGAANTMNAAYAHYLDRLFDWQSAGRYRPTRFEAEGTQLADEVWNAEDRGHLSDMAEIDRWARRFSLDRYIEWRDFEDVPDGYIGLPQR